MANLTNLDDLLRSIHSAVLEAQKLTEQQHIRQLYAYFDWPPPDPEKKLDPNLGHITLSGGKVRTWSLDIPSMDPNAKPDETQTIKVPLMSLIPPSAVKIKSMTVEFQVALKGLSSPLEETYSDKRNLSGVPHVQNEPLMIDMGGISGGFFNRKKNLAKIKIEFEASDPAESFLRINDHLIKSIV